MKMLYDEHPAMFRNHPLGFIGSVLLIAVGIGLIILLVWYLRTKAARLCITEHEILFEQGLLSKERSEISMHSVRTVRVRQSFFNRIFGVGTIEIFTAGDNPEIVVSGLPDPNRVRELIKAEQGSSRAA